MCAHASAHAERWWRANPAVGVAGVPNLEGLDSSRTRRITVTHALPKGGEQWPPDIGMSHCREGAVRSVHRCH